MGGGNGIKGMGKMSSRRLLLVNSRLGAVGKGGGGGSRKRIHSPEFSRTLLVQGMGVSFTLKV